MSRSWRYKAAQAIAARRGVRRRRREPSTERRDPTTVSPSTPRPTTPEITARKSTIVTPPRHQPLQPRTASQTPDRRPSRARVPSRNHVRHLPALRAGPPGGTRGDACTRDEPPLTITKPKDAEQFDRGRRWGRDGRARVIVAVTRRIRRHDPTSRDHRVVLTVQLRPHLPGRRSLPPRARQRTSPGRVTDARSARRPSAQVPREKASRTAVENAVPHRTRTAPRVQHAVDRPTDRDADRVDRRPTTSNRVSPCPRVYPGGFAAARRFVRRAVNSLAHEC